MIVKLQYGDGFVDVDVPTTRVTVLSPRFVPGLPDEAAAFLEAVRRPEGCAALRDAVRETDRVAVVVPDGTRPFPSNRVLPWLLEELAHVPRQRFTIIVGGGTHRAAAREELARLLGRGILQAVKVVGHSARDDRELLSTGLQAADGTPVRMNRHYVAADRRILLGFIEPHFFAGFSGGYKGVFPGVADIASIRTYHRPEVIGDERSTWGVLEGNPTQEQIRALGSSPPVDLLVNVALNRRHEITGFFCGDVLRAHEKGCAFVRDAATVTCAESFPVVLTSNSGSPLDQNLYQSVKGMDAAAQIVDPGGLIVMASRCNDGFPAHGDFARLLRESASPEDLLRTLCAPGVSVDDQWQAQKLALVLRRARVALYSELSPESVRQAHLEPVRDLGAYVAGVLARLGPDTPVAVLPEGPMTIPMRGGAGMGADSLPQDAVEAKKKADPPNGRIRCF